MGKILHFSACRGEEYFTAPHNTSRRGGFSFTPAPSVPHRQDKTHPTRLHQRPRAKKFAQHRQNCPKSVHFRPQGDLFAVWPRPPPAGRVFSRRWVPQPPHNTCRSPRLKPMTPMRVDHCHEMKPLTPLLPRSGQFQAIFQPQRRHRFHAPLTEHPQRRRRFHQTPNRAAGSQQGAQMLMLTASAMALIASSRSSPTRCTTWAWVTGRTRPQHPDIAYQHRGGGSQTGAPTPVAASQPQYANPLGCSSSTTNPGLTTSKPLAL